MGFSTHAASRIRRQLGQFLLHVVGGLGHRIRVRQFADHRSQAGGQLRERELELLLARAGTCPPLNPGYRGGGLLLVGVTGVLVTVIVRCT